MRVDELEVEMGRCFKVNHESTRMHPKGRGRFLAKRWLPALALPGFIRVGSCPFVVK